MDLPVTYNLKAYRGDTWLQAFRLIWQNEPLDLTSCEVACWAANPDGVWTLPVQSGGSDGMVTIGMPEAAEAMPATAYSYDIEVTEADGTVTTWIRGRLVVSQDVTHAVDLEEALDAA